MRPYHRQNTQWTPRNRSQSRSRNENYGNNQFRGRSRDRNQRRQEESRSRSNSRVSTNRDSCDAIDVENMIILHLSALIPRLMKRQIVRMQTQPLCR